MILRIKTFLFSVSVGLLFAAPFIVEIVEIIEIAEFDGLTAIETISE